MIYIGMRKINKIFFGYYTINGYEFRFGCVYLLCLIWDYN